MQQNTSNALKVGVAIVVALVVLFLGIRFLQNIPFSGTYNLYTEFEQVNGLIKGNAVQISGVDVGSVTQISLNPETQRVRVDMRINEGVEIPQGTEAEQTGISAFGTVQVVLHLAPPDNPPIEDDGFVPSLDADDLFTNLVNRVDSTLIGTSTTFQEIAGLLQEPSSDLRATLASISQLTNSLASMLEAERQTIGSLLENLDRTAVDLGTLSQTGNDSLAAVAGSLNQTLAEVQATMNQLQAVGANLDRLTAQIENGDGTLSLLLNDPRLYNSADSTLHNLNLLLLDLRANPKRYLQELKVVDLF